MGSRVVPNVSVQHLCSHQDVDKSSILRIRRLVARSNQHAEVLHMIPRRARATSLVELLIGYLVMLPAQRAELHCAISVLADHLAINTIHHEFISQLRETVQLQ